MSIVDLIFFSCYYQKMDGLSIGALIAGGTAILGTAINMFRVNRESASRNIEEGARREKLSTLEKDVDNLYAKIRHVEDEYSGLRNDITEMKSDIKHIIEKVDEISRRK